MAWGVCCILGSGGLWRLIVAGVFAFSSNVLAVAQGNAPDGMVWIGGGEFTMGSELPGTRRNEQPTHKVSVDGFWLDTHNVTNAEFLRFVEATRYITTAERPVDWEELKKQAPPGTPKPAPEMLLPGSLVFTPPAGPVDLRKMNAWWRWTHGCGLAASGRAWERFARA